MYDLYGKLIGNLSNYLYTYILIILLVAGGIYFTVRTKFVQFRYLKESLKVVLAPSEDDKAISSFQALMVSTASRVGTGNIAGVSTAICLGGLGSLFWMWLTALLGMSTAFVRELWLRSTSAVPMTAAATAVRPTISIRQPENTGSESCLQCS